MKRFLGRCLLVAAIVIGLSFVPAAILLGYVGYYGFLPRYSAVAELFDRYGFNLRLDLYKTDETRDSGRYLTVIEDPGMYRLTIAGTDWQHRARTSVYRVDPNRLAVLSALGHDYVLTLKPWSVASPDADRGDKWQYLGAFDFVFPAGAKPRLVFLDGAQAPECLPMGKTDPANWSAMPRPQARQEFCPTPPVPRD